MKIILAIFIAMSLTSQPSVAKVTPELFKNRRTTLNSHLKSYHRYSKKLNIDLPVQLNPLTKKWLAYYQGSGKSWFERSLKRSFRYLPSMRKVFAKKGLPKDLFYVALIESGFRAHATSHAQAVGYWQFIQGTSKRYGLKVSWWLDERRDYRKSTLAAGNYLWDLYNLFNSWPLALAAYNCGEGRVKRALKKHKATTFWQLVEKKALPKETRNYVPKITAAIIIAKAPKLYGFNIDKPKLPRKYDVIKVPGGTNLTELAYYLKTSERNMKALNPELIKGYVPSFVSNFKIRVPAGKRNQTNQYFANKAQNNIQ